MLKKTKNKSFSLLELILVILLLSIAFIQIKTNPSINDLELLTNRIVLYLKQTRYQSLIENHYSFDDNLWYMKRWSFKFLRCSNDKGLYYAIYSDENKTGQIAKNETLKDPLSNKYIYSSNSCTENEINSKYVLLTKNFKIENIDLLCNETSSLGQISFDSNGNVYTKLSKTQNNSEEYKLIEECILKISTKNEEKEIIIEPNGYIYRK